MTAPLTHISDTARWVAVYRAMETERPDAIFKDPFARRLAGAQGEAIVQALPQGRTWAWPMIVRTAVFDEMILRTVAADGVGTVLNLAAGLDTRPFRLPLPGDLRWLDADLPDMIAYKRAQLATETPRCRLEFVEIDLRDAERRRALAGDHGRPAHLPHRRPSGGVGRRPRRRGAALVAPRHRFAAVAENDAQDVAAPFGRCRRPVPVRARGEHAVLRAARVARARVALDLGGVAAAQALDASRLVVELHRPLLPQTHAGAAPALLGSGAAGKPTVGDGRRRQRAADETAGSGCDP